MAVSDDKLRANILNAQKSTGPQTPEGKQRSSMNATKTGLTGRTIVLPGESMQTYLAFRHRWFDEFQPQGNFEEELLQTIVDCKWRLNRVVTSEEGIHARGFQRLDDIDTGNPAADEAIAAAVTTEQCARTLDSLSRHEARITRQFHTTINKLSEVQAARKQCEKEALEQAIEIHNLHKMLEKSYEPQEFGFEFTAGRIAQAARSIQVRDHARIAKRVGYDRQKFLHATA